MDFRYFPRADLNEPLDGQWGAWAAWQGCSVTCGSGSRRRYRNCDNPSPDFGGAACAGDSFEQEACSTGSNCPKTRKCFSLLVR